MTPLEYVELVAVETARYDAKKIVSARRCGKNEDNMDWKRYINALSDQLWHNGLDGVR